MDSGDEADEWLRRESDPEGWDPHDYACLMGSGPLLPLLQTMQGVPFENASFGTLPWQAGCRVDNNQRAYNSGLNVGKCGL